MKQLKRFLISITVFVVCICNFSFALSHRDWSGDENDTYIEINNNIPDFTQDEINTHEFTIIYGYDNLNREKGCFMNASPITLPKSEREPSLSNVTPSGWKYNGKSNNNKYHGVVSGNYIFNRSHLLGYQYSGLGSETPANLITGTRWFNVISMLPFENDIKEYIKATNNHVLVKSIPIWENNNLVAEGIQFEAYSVEDNGKGICFNVFCPNVQPGIVIDYATGQNWLEKDAPEEFKTVKEEVVVDTSQTEEPQVIVDTRTPKQILKEQLGIFDYAEGGGGILMLVFIVWILFFSNRGSSGSSYSSNYSGRRR